MFSCFNESVSGDYKLQLVLECKIYFIKFETNLIGQSKTVDKKKVKIY